VPIGRPTLNGRELGLLLKEHGFWRLKDRGKGSHEIWVDASGRQVTVSVGVTISLLEPSKASSGKRSKK
jgi:predicted RNA binding protein YcfA (HicA-like mRNA interferase family)